MITYIPTEDNITDLFTKALPHPQFKKLVKMMGFLQEMMASTSYGIRGSVEV
jgi:hypothetical protein